MTPGTRGTDRPDRPRPLFQIHFLEKIELGGGVVEDARQGPQCGVVRRQRVLQTSRHLPQSAQLLHGPRQAGLAQEAGAALTDPGVRQTLLGPRGFQFRLPRDLLTELQLLHPQRLPELQQVPLDVVQFGDGQLAGGQAGAGPAGGGVPVRVEADHGALQLLGQRDVAVRHVGRAGGGGGEVRQEIVDRDDQVIHLSLLSR